MEKIIEIDREKFSKKLKNNIPERIVIHSEPSFQDTYARETVKLIETLLNPI